MAKAILKTDEERIQKILVQGEFAEAKRLLQKCTDIRPVYRKIFEAAIALAEEEYETAWAAISEGLKLDTRNYELYVMLGDYYASKNLHQAYLCYENALFYCHDSQDCEQIKLLLNEFSAQGITVPKAAIVILSYNLLDMTRDCVESIRNTTPKAAREIIVIDNASMDDSVEWLKGQKDIKLLCNGENKGFPAACNQGIDLADAESDIFLLNNDTVLMDNALFWLRMGLYESEEVGSVGSVTNHMSNFQTVVDDGKTEKEYREFAVKNNVPMKYPYQNKMYLTGFALLLKREVLNKVGLLDERFFPGNFEDNDLCLRINLAGFRNVLCKNSFIIHWGSSSFKKEPEKFQNVLDINQRKFFEKWSTIGLDPAGYWNIRLDLVSMLEKKSDISDDTILVVGTGCGSLLGCLKERFPDSRVYGMEQHQYMAQIADRIAETFWVNLDEWKGDDLADTFDIIVINDSLEYTKKPEAVLTELVKTLKEDGHVAVSFANKFHFSRIGRDITDRRLFDQRQMREMLSRAKLTKDDWAYTQAGGRTPELERRVRQLQEQYSMVNSEELYAYQWLTVVERQRTDLKFGNRMVVCIPTYEHPEVVQEVLENCAETYHRYGLDVYYYDSSRDTRTRDVIEAYQKKGYDNLYYIQVDPEMPVPEKLEHVLMMKDIPKEYTYMWYLRDRCWCEEKTLKLIYKAMEQPHDLIFMDVGHPDTPHELSISRNANEFYHSCGNYATSMDTAIYNVKAMLKDDVNMADFHARHGIYKDGFLHFLLIFEQLAQKTNPDICLLGGKNVVIYHSHKGNSGWGEKRILIWGTYWIQANESLPGCYTKKEEVIKRTASMPWLLGDINALIELHDKGILTPEYYEEVKEFWERVSNIPLGTLRQIAYGEYNIYYDPLQLKGEASGIMVAFLQRYEAVVNDSLALQEIPWRELLNVIKQQAMADGTKTDAYNGMLDKMLDNIKNLAKEKPEDKERVLELLQIIIGLLMLIQ